MSFREDDYIKLLLNLRIIDLKALLRTYCNDLSGSRAKLQGRALELLRSKPVSLNYEEYLAKIRKIHTSMINDRLKINNSRKKVKKQSEQHTKSFEEQQPPSPPPNLQQSMHIQRDGLNLVMPQMPIGIDGDNSPGVSNIQPTSPRNITPITRFPLNQPERNFYPSTQILNNIKLKNKPFNEIVDAMVRPTFLVGKICTTPNNLIGMKEELFEFTLTLNQANFITLNRDISDGKNEYIYQIQMRICKYEDGYTEITDFLPSELYIRVNNKVCPLPPITNSHLGTEAKRIAKPLDCAELFKLSPNVPNKIYVKWTPDGNTYIFALYLVKNLTADELLKKLYNKERRSSEDTKNYIIRKLADVDSDLSTTSYRFSLVCPLGKIRMKTPAKSKNCDHLRCFDASTFILMNEKKPTWTCPMCNQPCLYDDLQIESYFLEIVESPSLPEECNEIEILADGTWRVYEENNEPTGSTTMEVKNVPNELEKFKSPIVDLTISDDENSTEEKNKPNPDGSSKESENLKSFFSEWNLGDDE